MIGHVVGHVRDRMLRGLLIALPLLITVWLLNLLFGLVSDVASPVVAAALKAAGFERLDQWPARALIPLAGLLLTGLLIYLIGLLAANLIGRRLLEMFERGLLRVPLVKSIYGGSRQLLDAFKAGQSGGFSRVVLVEYPRRGTWTVAFVTNESALDVGSRASEAEGTLLLFLPTTPNPTSGWLVLVPRRDVLDLDVTVEEGIKLVVSGGIIAPGDLPARARPPRRAPGSAGGTG